MSLTQFSELPVAESFDPYDLRSKGSTDLEMKQGAFLPDRTGTNMLQNLFWLVHANLGRERRQHLGPQMAPDAPLNFSKMACWTTLFQACHISSHLASHPQAG